MDDNESYERASADLEILQAAYPDEISIDSVGDNFFPIIFTLTLPMSPTSSIAEKSFGANITMEYPKGYPLNAIEIVSYRTNPKFDKKLIESVVDAVRSKAKEGMENEEESGFACCAAAVQQWTECLEGLNKENEVIKHKISLDLHETKKDDDITWITSDKTLIDRKSVFQAHCCAVSSSDMVNRAVNQLIMSNSKIQRATHNMFAYRFSAVKEDGREILIHDNDDDGEDGAGSRLAQLLESRKEDGILVLVSRWYGGVHLGPKRFAHIVNVARDLLNDCHEKGIFTKQ